MGIAEQLIQLKELRDSGALTDDEFTDAKAAIIGAAKSPTHGSPSPDVEHGQPTTSPVKPHIQEPPSRADVKARPDLSTPVDQSHARSRALSGRVVPPVLPASTPGAIHESERQPEFVHTTPNPHVRPKGFWDAGRLIAVVVLLAAAAIAAYMMLIAGGLVLVDATSNPPPAAVSYQPHPQAVQPSQESSNDRRSLRAAGPPDPKPWLGKSLEFALPTQQLTITVSIGSVYVQSRLEGEIEIAGLQTWCQSDFRAYLVPDGQNLEAHVAGAPTGCGTIASDAVIFRLKRDATGSITMSYLAPALGG